MSEETVEELNVEVMDHESTSNESYLSFDEVDSLTSTKTDEEAVKEAVAMESEKKEVVKAEEEAADEVIEEKAEPDKPVAESTPEEEAQAEIKKITGKFGESELEVAADTIFKHTVDGEEQEVTLQTLLNNYSGKIPYDKKFQELTESRKNHEQEVKEVESYINKFSELMDQKDTLGALSYFAEFSGKSPLEFRKELRDSLFPQFEQMSQMNEEQKESFLLKEENEFFKSKQESDAQLMAEKQAQDALHRQIDSIQETHNLSDEDMLKAYDELKANYKEEITADLIGEYCVQSRAIGKSEELLNLVNQDLSQDDAIVENLSNEIIANPSFTDDDWVEMLKEAYDVKPKKSNSKTVSNKLRSAKKDVDEEEIVPMNLDESFSFDDL